MKFSKLMLASLMALSLTACSSNTAEEVDTSAKEAQNEELEQETGSEEGAEKVEEETDSTAFAG